MSCQSCGQTTQGVCYVLEHIGTEPIYVDGQRYGQGDFCFDTPQHVVEYQGIQYQIDLSLAPEVQNIYGCCPSGTKAKLGTITTTQGQTTPVFVPYAILVGTSQGGGTTTSTSSFLSKIPWWLIIILIILGAIILGGGSNP